MRAGCQSLLNSDQTVKLGSADQNMNQYSVTVMPFSRLKCFQNHLVVYCLAVKWESLWRSRHCKICWRKPSSGHMTGAQPIGTLSLSLKWPVIDQNLQSLDFSKAWKQSHEEEQKSSFLSDHLNYNMMKDYYGIFAKLCQKIVAYCHFNWQRDRWQHRDTTWFQRR